MKQTNETNQTQTQIEQETTTKSTVVESSNMGRNVKLVVFLILALALSYFGCDQYNKYNNGSTTPTEEVDTPESSDSTSSDTDLGIGEPFSTDESQLGELTDSVGETLKGTASEVTDALGATGLVSGVAGAAGTLTDAGSDLIDNATETLSNATETLTNAGNKLTGSATEAAAEAKTGLVDGIKYIDVTKTSPEEFIANGNKNPAMTKSVKKLTAGTAAFECSSFMNAKTHYGTFPVTSNNLCYNDSGITGSFAVDVSGLQITDQSLPIEYSNQLRDHLLSPDFLNAQVNPTSKFVVTTSSSLQDNAYYTVTGDFTLNGETRPMTVIVMKNEDSLTSEFNIDRKDFGIVYGSNTYDVNSEEYGSLSDKMKEALISDNVNLIINLTN